MISLESVQPVESSDQSEVRGDLRAEVAARQHALLQRRVQQQLQRFGDIPRRSLDRPVPDFVIIGAAKAGTTSLFATLQSHPQIAPSLVKETDFFSLDTLFAKGLPWYRSLFGDQSPDQLLGEASTSYSRLPLHPATADRVFRANPAAKVIYLTRDPVQRAYSHMIHRWQRELFPDRAFDVDPGNFLRADPMPVTSSLYEQQLEPWRSRFGDDQIHVMMFEELVQNPRETLTLLCEFIGIDANHELSLFAANQSQDFQSKTLANSMVKSWKSTGMGRTLARILPKQCREFIYDHVARPYGRIVAKTRASVPPLDAQLQATIETQLSEGRIGQLA